MEPVFITMLTICGATVLAQVYPEEDEDRIFDQLLEIYKAWPNLRMVEFADALLARDGRLTSAVGQLYRKQL